VLFEPLKLEGKKKNFKSKFLSSIWFEESQRGKNREEKYEKNLNCYAKKKVLPNMRGK